MTFNINKQRANRAAEIARGVINRTYGGQIPDENMVCIVTASKVTETALKIGYNFRFEFKKNKPYVGQVIFNEDMSVTKILDIIQ
jgi:hypothetical protein